MTYIDAPFLVKISGTEVMKGLQIAAHSTSGAWEILYGEFIQFPDSIKPYQYYSSVKVSTSKNSLVI